MNLPDFTLKGSCELTYTNEINELTLAKIEIEDAYFLVYNWPDDEDGANTTITINLHFYFILDKKKYQIGTKTTFYDNDVAKYDDLQNWYFAGIYPAMVQNALMLSKKEIELKLNSSLDSIAPFDTQDEQVISLTKEAQKNQQIDYV